MQGRWLQGCRQEPSTRSPAGQGWLPQGGREGWWPHGGQVAWRGGRLRQSQATVLLGQPAVPRLVGQEAGRALLLPTLAPTPMLGSPAPPYRHSAALSPHSNPSPAAELACLGQADRWRGHAVLWGLWGRPSCGSGAVSHAQCTYLNMAGGGGGGREFRV